MIHEVLMAPGSGEIELRPDTPSKVLDEITDKAFGHVVVRSSWVDPRKMSDADLLAGALWTGVYRRESASRHVLECAGLVTWFGDEDGKGDLFETAPATVARSATGWIDNQIMPQAQGLTRGVIGPALAAKANKTHAIADGTDARTVLLHLMDLFDGEFRCNPNFVVDFGTADELFRNTPQVMVSDLGNGPEPFVFGFDGELTEASDWEGYTTKVLLKGTAASPGTATAAATPYCNPAGNPVKWKRWVDSPRTNNGNEAQRAAKILGRHDSVRQTIALDTTAFDPRRHFDVGDNVWVWHPAAGISNTANAVRYRGRLIHPKAVRAVGCDWPLRDPHGVYFRYFPLGGGTVQWVDLSRWFVREEPTATITIGKKLRVYDHTRGV